MNKSSRRPAMKKMIKHSKLRIDIGTREGGVQFLEVEAEGEGEPLSTKH